MTAKEKAKELVDMHINPFNLKGCSHPIHTLFESTAKQCAINTVDEIIKSQKCCDECQMEGSIEMAYWNEVKHEIKKL
jgi:hypothetical protein